VATDLETRLYELFANKEELLPLWLWFRPAVQDFGPDVRVTPHDSYAEFDRKGAAFAIAEPTSHHRMDVGLHNPGLPFTGRFRTAHEFGSRRITHRVSLPENTERIDDELHARLHEAYALALDGEPR
jgi:hypothetical protein